MSILKDIEDKIRNNLQTTYLEIQDKTASHANHYAQILTKDGDIIPTHLHIIISSPLFIDISEVEAHKKIYAELKEAFNIGLHAVSIDIK
ncbi:MAG: BolA/IbaG family iron-sulfur metabolism protein [Rickettsiales bacterium]